MLKENFYTAGHVKSIGYTGQSYVEIFDDITYKDLNNIPSWHNSQEVRGLYSVAENKVYIWNASELHENVIPVMFPNLNPHDIVTFDVSVLMDNRTAKRTIDVWSSGNHDNKIIANDVIKAKFQSLYPSINIKTYESTMVYKRYFKEQSPLPHKGVLRIKDPTLYYIADRLLNTIGLPTDFKAIKKLNDNKLLQAFSKKTGQEFQKSIGMKSFNLDDIQKFDKSLNRNDTTVKNAETYSIFNDPIVTSKIKKDLTTWAGAQRYITNLDNHVLQFNVDWEWLKSYLQYSAGFETDTNDRLNADKVKAYMKASNHPTSRTKLTLGWVRFTLLKPGHIIDDQWIPMKEVNSEEQSDSYKEKVIVVDEKSCILDEIQTDLNDNSFLGEELMKGWEIYIMQKFIHFIRGSLKIRKIYMPTYDTKQNLYSANPPMYLYKEIPNKFGFKKDSDMAGFMLLEKVKP